VWGVVCGEMGRINKNSLLNPVSSILSPQS
jgi:hypothetical protein